MWIAIYTLLRIIAPFHTVLSWLLSFFLVISCIGGLVTGRFVGAAMAAFLVFALHLFRTNYVSWTAAAKNRAYATDKVDA